MAINKEFFLCVHVQHTKLDGWIRWANDDDSSMVAEPVGDYKIVKFSGILSEGLFAHPSTKVESAIVSCDCD